MRAREPLKKPGRGAVGDDRCAIAAWADAACGSRDVKGVHPRIGDAWRAHAGGWKATSDGCVEA